MKLLVKLFLVLGCFSSMIAMDRKTLNRQLSEAAGAGDGERVEALIAQGARDFNLALAVAARGGQIAIARFLIDKHGANDFNTALAVAARGGHIDIFRLLIDEHGANAFNWALESAVEGGHIAIDLPR